MLRKIFKKQDIKQLEILTKWAESHNISFSGKESSVITSAMVEYAQMQVNKLTIPDVIQQSELLPLSFIVWYTKIEKEKLLIAYGYWKKESGNSV